MIFQVNFAYLRGHTIVYHFCILKRVNQLLGFSLPDTKVFQYLRRRTYVIRLFYQSTYFKFRLVQHAIYTLVSFIFSMHIIFQLVMIKNNLFVPCALVSFMRLHRLETHDNRGYLHDILGYFCILKGAYHSLPFSLPETTVFQYLTRHT